MKLTALQALFTGAAAYTSVYVDVSRTEADGQHQVELRWRELAAGLAEDGLHGEAIERLSTTILEPTGEGGQLGRGVILAGDEVLLDDLLPRVPQDYGHVGRLPHVMPLLRARADETAYFMVKVDHSGADIMAVEGAGRAPRTQRSEGDHDVVHKVPGGGWSHRRYQSRVEDSWERNATQVAHDLDVAVARHGPEVIFLVGEQSARSFVHDHASGRVAERLADLDHGSRAAGTSESSLHEAVDAALAQHRNRREAEWLDTFASRLGRDEAVVTGFSAVVDALRRGAVESLLLTDKPESTLRLAAGPEPLHLGRTEAEVSGLGTDDVFEDRADEVMVRALVAQDAEIVLIAEPRDDLADGVGALLRFDSRPPRPDAG